MRVVESLHTAARSRKADRMVERKWIMSEEEIDW